MPHARHRLDLYVVAAEVERPLTEEDASALLALGEVAEGGQAALRLDRPRAVALYANQQGGFRVRCPDTGADVVGAFGRAVGVWRRGGPRAVDCACGRTHPLEALTYAPSAAYGRWALVAIDAASPTLSAGARAAIEARIGPVRVVARRPG